MKNLQVRKNKTISSDSVGEIDLLKQFLEYPVWTSKPIFERFKSLKDSIYRELNDKGKKRFLFIQGDRQKKVLLVAHADTFFDEFYGYSKKQHFIEIENNCFIGKTENGERVAIGADDRAGCAILWALKDSGNSILITDGEEGGGIGSHWLMEQNQDVEKIINEHQFVIQFDRRNSSDFKCYEVGTELFRVFITKSTKYTEPDRRSYTDICTICKEICGVNFSIGYYDEHKNSERINFVEWSNTLNIVKRMLERDLPRFNLMA